MSERTVYVVQKVHWEYNDRWYDPSHDEPVRAFVCRERAEMLRAELEAQEEQQYDSLIRFAGGLQRATSHSEDEIVVFLRRHGVAPPPLIDHPNSQHLRWGDTDWWDQAWQTLDEAARVEFRRMLDKVRFYEVVAMQLQGERTPEP